MESDIEERHIELLISLATLSNGTQLDMPHNITAFNEYGKVVITSCVESFSMNIPFCEGVFEICNGELIVERVKARISDDNALYFSGDYLEDNTVIRYRQEGDSIAKFGGGRKSLGDFMTDKKIPLRLRDVTPVIANGSNILCVAGVDISKTVSVNNCTDIIFKISINEF